MNHEILHIDPSKTPNVLFLGNGLLRLNNGKNWGELLNSISKRDIPNQVLDLVPTAMQPEVLCGTEVEEVQRQIAEVIESVSPHQIIKDLVSLPFDAILTTNYTYEIEQALTNGKWSEYRRRKAFTILDGSSHVRHNTFICNMVVTADGRVVPVFHIHGEKARKGSLVLSYYSYAASVSRLFEYNKRRGNIYQEKQDSSEELICHSWLDYYLLGNVYAVGFGFDTSEFDIWWATERKAREKAKHGPLIIFLTENTDKLTSQKVLYEAMAVKWESYRTDPDYASGYRKIYERISTILNNCDKGVLS